jgi:hypothetical protein
MHHLVEEVKITPNKIALKSRKDSVGQEEPKRGCGGGGSRSGSAMVDNGEGGCQRPRQKKKLAVVSCSVIIYI